LLKPITVAEIAGLLHNINQYEKKSLKHDIITISTREYKYNVELSRILYFSTVGKKLYARMLNGEKLEFYGTISELEKKYVDFTRCHSGFLVNKLYVKGICRGELELNGCKETLPISKKYKNVFNRLIVG